MSEKRDIVERLRMWSRAEPLWGYIVIDWSGERDQCRLVSDLDEAAREIVVLRAAIKARSPQTDDGVNNG